MIEVWRVERRPDGPVYTKEVEVAGLWRAVKAALMLGRGCYRLCGPRGNVVRLRVGGARA